MNKRIGRKAVVMIASVLILINASQRAEAQRKGRNGMRPGNVTTAQLLAVDTIQKELKLTDEQKAKIREINQTVTEGRKKLFAEVTKESGERTPKVTEMNKKADADIAKLLDETQRKRLQEIMLQANGAAELANKEIREALHITKEQDAKLKELRRENTKTRQDALAHYEGDRTAKMVELQKAADQKLLDVLTPEQRKHFEEMQGTKIDLTLFSS